MTNQQVHIQLDGYEYVWDGKDWYNRKTYAIPPTAIIMLLNAELGKLLGVAPRKLSLA